MFRVIRRLNKDIDKQILEELLIRNLSKIKL
jgi:hypothetical protein